ncbi:MAG: hypothetical protein ACOYEP_05490 [Limnochordia bacterium]|jgi:hypothetical protein
MPADMAAQHSYTARHTVAEKDPTENIDLVFHRLLELPRDSEEFSRLWRLLDAYLDTEIIGPRSS